MIEIRLEIKPQNKTPLECVNLIVETLESLVENQDIETYAVSLPSLDRTFETIHAGGKDVKT